MPEEIKQEAVSQEEAQSEDQRSEVDAVADASEAPGEGDEQQEQTPAEGDEQQEQTPVEGPVAEGAEDESQGDEVQGTPESAPSDSAGETPPEDQSEEASDEGQGLESRQDLEDEFPDLSQVKVEETMAHPAQFQQLSSVPGEQAIGHNIDLLMDVKMPVSIELGRTEMPISEILGLGPGSVVELDKLAGEPVDLLVNNKVVARGEVVVVDENFGVRITMLMSPQERLKSLSK